MLGLMTFQEEGWSFRLCPRHSLRLGGVVRRPGTGRNYEIKRIEKKREKKVKEGWRKTPKEGEKKRQKVVCSFSG